MSEEYRALPVSFGGASMRSVSWLMYLVSVGQLGIVNDLHFACSFDAGGFQRGLHDARMRAATASVSRAGVFHIVGVWVRIFLQQSRHAHQKSGRAIAAHQRVLDRKSIVWG